MSYFIDPAACIDCAACVDVCPVEAIHPTPPPPQCETCKFFRAPTREATEGLCVRNAPGVTLAPFDRASPRWPTAMKGETCGEFQAT